MMGRSIEYLHEVGMDGGIALPSMGQQHLVTDKEFFARHGNLDKQCGGDQKEVNRIVKAAKRNGFTPSQNAVYFPTMADKPGDPKAFIHPTDGRAAVDRLTQGAVIPRQPKRVALAERTIKRYMRKMLAADPGLASRSPADLRAEIIAKHARL
jgi:hypothetical protein